ncbi:MAG TPA: class I SAM-dependent methyltransferase [Mariniphaga anaerophila]|uniref:Class I SAM-dependent methyltransferase n=1 Tax=Mariniphaga anaerophila TaxID=1484053 RepID=A0A831PJX4_9BACT|nr:class I SAM-dependent methyltransferase [Mariniphaga anaerophila]
MNKFHFRSVNQELICEKQNIKSTGRIIQLGLIIFILSVINLPQAKAQDLDVPYVPTPNNVVEKMLDMAHVGPGDYVIDLGSGDGRIVIAAAKRGAFGHGVDIDPKRIAEARVNAKNAGVEDKVVFMQENIFNTDFSRASVVTMYLLNSVNIKLRKHLLNNLRPGSRLVSNDFDMGKWKADDYIRELHNDIYFWVIPANVKGHWRWSVGDNTFTMQANQEFQELFLNVKNDDSALAVKDMVMRGDRISFAASDFERGIDYNFSGHIDEDAITGVVQVRKGTNAEIKNWSAIRFMKEVE